MNKEDNTKITENMTSGDVRATRDSEPRAVMGLRLREIRREFHLSQSDVAAMTGISQAMVSQVESGGRDLPVSALAALCSSIGIDPRNLISRPTFTDARRGLAAGWRAYDRARTRCIEMAHISRDLVSKFKQHEKALTKILDDPSELQQIRTAIDQLIRSTTKDEFPKSDNHPDFASVFEPTPADTRRLESILSLMEECSQISEHDLDLLKAAVRWMRARGTKA